MKKLVITAVAALSIVGVAHAEQDNVGCGLGSMIFNGQRGIAPQVLAATTNGTFGNQTFGISTGTLGCTQDGVVRSTAKLSMFTGSNMDKLASDMSRGQGETLATFADLMGVKDADKSAFYGAARANFDKIFTSANVTAEEVIANTRKVLASA